MRCVLDPHRDFQFPRIHWPPRRVPSHPIAPRRGARFDVHWHQWINKVEISGRVRARLSPLQMKTLAVRRSALPMQKQTKIVQCWDTEGLIRVVSPLMVERNQALTIAIPPLGSPAWQTSILPVTVPRTFWLALSTVLLLLPLLEVLFDELLDCNNRLR